MIVKPKILLFVIFVYSYINLHSQFSYPNYFKYPFINQVENHLKIYGTKSWTQFFKKLDSQYLNGNEKINIMHFGGSHIQADIWSNKMRTNFQNTLPHNQSGRGFIFPFRLINSNGSSSVKSSHIGRWKGFRNSVNSHSGPFGLLGARAELIDSFSVIKVWNDHSLNSCESFNSLTVFYKDSSNSYDVNVLVDSGNTFSTSRQRESITFSFEKTIDSIAIEVKKNKSTVSNFSFFGLLLDNDCKGITYHSIGVNGASVKSYLRGEDFTHQLALIKPDLVILSIGINDAYEENFNDEYFYSSYDSLINKIRSVNPQVAILLTTNNDSYYKREYPNQRALQVQKKMYELAENKDLAVWDMFEVMGGLNSIRNWEKNNLAKKDLIHLTAKGYNLIGDLLFEALMKSYLKHKKPHD